MVFVAVSVPPGPLTASVAAWPPVAHRLIASVRPRLRVTPPSKSDAESAFWEVQAGRLGLPTEHRSPAGGVPWVNRKMAGAGGGGGGGSVVVMVVVVVVMVVVVMVVVVMVSPASARSAAGIRPTLSQRAMSPAARR